MGLRQADDSVRADVGVMDEHFLLLSVHHRKYSETVPQPAWEPLFKVRDLVFERFQPFPCQFNVIHLLANRLPAFGSCPLLAFGKLEVGFSGFLGGIGQFVTVMRDLFPQNLNGGFQVFTALVQQVDVCGVLDIGGRDCGVQ